MVLNKVLVTGATGMVGRPLVDTLCKAGVSVLACSRSRPNRLPATGKWVRWDLREWLDSETLSTHFGRIDAIIHAGALVPKSGIDLTSQDLFDTNVRVCLNIGEWALEHDIPVVFISGSTVYAEFENFDLPDRPGLNEESPTSPHGGGVYGFTKFLAEQTFENLRARGLRVCILRPSSIYGDGLPEGKMITGFLAVAANNEVIVLSPPADDRIDLVHTSDVARAAILPLEKEAWGIFNIASGEPVTVEEIARSCVRAAGAGSVTVGAEPAKRKAMTRFGLDVTRARTRLDFRPQVSLDQGLRQMARI